MHYGNSLITAFEETFASVNEMLSLAGILGARLLFYEFLRFSWYFLISEDPKSYAFWKLVGQFVYTMFISNNHATFHL